MKNFYTLFTILFFALSVTAQISDRSETDCDGNVRSVYEVGSEGKPLIIASKGFDCSICVNHAPNVGSFASAYAGQIEVWGAMTYTYSQTIPTCANVDSWISSYSWSDVFTFVDASEYWFGVGTPTYRVIHPVTHEQIYSGGNWNTATSTALGLLTLNSTEIEEEKLSVKVFSDGQNLHIETSNLLASPFSVQVVNLVGQIVSTLNLQNNKPGEILKVPFSNKPGIYILQLSQNGYVTAVKFVVN
jgi:hypothetical protein